jgi:hypothetical protein
MSESSSIADPPIHGNVGVHYLAAIYLRRSIQAGLMALFKRDEALG